MTTHRDSSARLDLDDSPPRLLFIHVMRAAGMSVRRMIDRELGYGGIYPNDTIKRTFRHGWYPKATEVLEGYDDLPPHRVLAGQFPAALRDALPAPYLGAVFLRDPVQRTMSSIEHLRRRPDQVGLSAHEALDMAPYVAAQVADYQTKVLGMGIGIATRSWPTDDATLAEALARLEAMEFVGITEDFAGSCAVFDAMFGTAMASRMLHENRGRPDGDVPADLERRIAPLVERDAVVYRAALERHRSDLRTLSKRTFDLAAPGGAAAGQQPALRTFDALWPPRPGRGSTQADPSEGTVPPVFVGGTGRSGTTIVAKLVGAHSAAHRIGVEVRFITDEGGVIDWRAGQTTLDAFKERITGPWWYRRRVDGATRGLFTVVGRGELLDALEDFELASSADSRRAASGLVRRLLDPVAARHGAQTWVEDTPANVEAAAGIVDLFPDARIIHVIRDGRDVACSVASLTWGPNDVPGALEWWAQRLLASHRGSADLPQVLTIRMEDLTSRRPQETYDRILDHLGWDDDPAMSRFFADKVDTGRARINRWERDVPDELKPALNARYEVLCAELAAAGVPTFS